MNRQRRELMRWRGATACVAQRRRRARNLLSMFDPSVV